MFQGVARVVGAWQHRDDEVFSRFPTWLKSEFPETFEAIDDEALGELCSLVWMLGAGRGSIQQHVFLNWWRDAVRGPDSA